MMVVSKLGSNIWFLYYMSYLWLPFFTRFVTVTAKTNSVIKTRHIRDKCPHVQVQIQEHLGELYKSYI